MAADQEYNDSIDTNHPEDGTEAFFGSGEDLEAFVGADFREQSSLGVLGNFDASLFGHVISAEKYLPIAPVVTNKDNILSAAILFGVQRYSFIGKTDSLEHVEDDMMECSESNSELGLNATMTDPKPSLKRYKSAIENMRRELTLVTQNDSDNASTQHLKSLIIQEHNRVQQVKREGQKPMKVDSFWGLFKRVSKTNFT